MVKKTLGTVFLLVTLIGTLFAATCFAQTRSPYAGKEKRTVTAFSAKEMEQYLAGRRARHGTCRAAELNHYPGPRHVLELSEDLGLTDGQREN